MMCMMFMYTISIRLQNMTNSFQQSQSKGDNQKTAYGADDKGVCTVCTVGAVKPPWIVHLIFNMNDILHCHNNYSAAAWNVCWGAEWWQQG